MATVAQQAEQETAGSLVGAMTFLMVSRLVVPTWAPILAPLSSAMLLAFAIFEPLVVVIAWVTS